MHCWSMFSIRYSAEQLFLGGGGGRDVVSANCKFAHAVTHNRALTSRDRRNKREVANRIALEPQTAHFSSASRTALHWLVVVPGSHSHFPIALTHFSHDCENVQQSQVCMFLMLASHSSSTKWNEIFKKNEVLYQTTQCFDHCISLKKKWNKRHILLMIFVSAPSARVHWKHFLCTIMSGFFFFNAQPYYHCCYY